MRVGSSLTSFDFIFEFFFLFFLILCRNRQPNTFVHFIALHGNSERSKTISSVTWRTEFTDMDRHDYSFILDFFLAAKLFKRINKSSCERPTNLPFHQYILHIKYSGKI